MADHDDTDLDNIEMARIISHIWFDRSTKKAALTGQWRLW